MAIHVPSSVWRLVELNADARNVGSRALYPERAAVGTRIVGRGDLALDAAPQGAGVAERVLPRRRQPLDLVAAPREASGDARRRRPPRPSPSRCRRPRCDPTAAAARRRRRASVWPAAMRVNTCAWNCGCPSPPIEP